MNYLYIFISILTLKETFKRKRTGDLQEELQKQQDYQYCLINHFITFKENIHERELTIYT